MDRIANPNNYLCKKFYSKAPAYKSSLKYLKHQTNIQILYLTSIIAIIVAENTNKKGRLNTADLISK